MKRWKKKTLEPPGHVRLKKNDLVEVLSGKEGGKTGKVLIVLRERNQVVVEKVNMIKRHTRPSPSTGQGGIVEKEGPLSISKVMLVCPKCTTATRFSLGQTAEGKKSRVCRHCHEFIDG
jgi:large subunit ribosomal protein L24